MRCAPVTMFQSPWYVLIGWILTMPPVLAQAGPFPLAPPAAGPNASLWLYGSHLAHDLDGDGREDVVACLGGTVGVMVAGPGGTYGAPTYYAPFRANVVGSAITHIGDVTGDGQPDIVGFYTLYVSPLIVPFVMLGSGPAGFSSTILLPAPSDQTIQLPFVAEIIPNGYPEIVVTSTVATSAPLARLDILVFQPQSMSWSVVGSTTVSPPGTIPGFLGHGDFNGDGLPDLAGVIDSGASLSGFSHVFVVPGAANAPYFGAPVLFHHPQYADNRPFNITDLNGDGLSDIVWRGADSTATNWAAVVALGNPQSILAMPWIIDNPINRDSFWGVGTYLEDFDVDGNVDLMLRWHPNPAVPLTTSNVDFHRGDGQGNFGTPMTLANNPPGFLLCVPADADGDGDKDLVSIMTPTTMVCFNESRLGFGTPSSLGMVPSLQHGTPSLGSANFGIGLVSALPLAPIALGASFAQAPTPPAPGIVIDLAPSSLLWPLGALGPLSTDAFGQAWFAIPLPNTPALSGATIFVQWGVGDPGTPSGFALSQGSKIILF